MASMNEFGNNLYSGKTSFPFVGKRRLWFIIAIALVVGSALVPLIRPIQFSIEFTGGSQFTVQAPDSTDQDPAAEAVRSVVPGAAAKVAIVSSTDVRVQTDQMSSAEPSRSRTPSPRRTRSTRQRSRRRSSVRPGVRTSPSSPCGGSRSSSP